MEDTTKRVCAFCGGSDLTAEHLWPDWIGKRLSSLARKELPFQVHRETWEGEQAWVSQGVNETVKRFCRTCNTGWMSAIENQTIPILEPMMLIKGDENIVLSPRDQMMLGRWAYKTALVAEFAIEGGPFIPESWFAEFYQRRWPPGHGAVIWTCAYHGEQRATHAYRWRSDITSVPGPNVDLPPQPTVTKVCVFTLAAYRAVFQVLLFYGGEWTPTVDGSSFGPILTRLWPGTGIPVNWPKIRDVLDTAGLLRFSKRLDFN